jgi:hypothetical protein
MTPTNYIITASAIAVAIFGRKKGRGTDDGRKDADSAHERSPKCIIERPPRHHTGATPTPVSPASMFWSYTTQKCLEAPVGIFNIKRIWIQMAVSFSCVVYPPYHMAISGWKRLKAVNKN